MALYLVRHAHSHWQPSEERPLSSQGLAQASRVAALLARFSPTAIYSSPARRAVQTVEPLAQDLDLQPLLEVDLRERVLSGAPVDDFPAAVRTTWSTPSFAFPGGESNEAAQQRAIAVLRRIVNAEGERPTVVSTHGNLLALALAAVEPSIGFDFWRALSFPDVFRLELREPLGRSTFVRVWD